jgi:hypothetical protein
MNSTYGTPAINHFIDNNWVDCWEKNQGMTHKRFENNEIKTPMNKIITPTRELFDEMGSNKYKELPTNKCMCKSGRGSDHLGIVFEIQIPPKFLTV